MSDQNSYYAFDAEIKRLRVQRDLGNAAIREAEEWRTEVERLHRWLSEMVADYKLDADLHPASQQVAINELIHRLRGFLQVCMYQWIPFAEVEFRQRVKEALGHDPLDR